MKDYNEFINKINESKIIFEMSIDKNMKTKVKRLKNANDFLGILKKFNELKTTIINELEKIEFDKIKYIKDSDEIYFKYSTKISALFDNLEELCSEADDDDLNNKMWQDGFGILDLRLNVKIDKTNMNQIHILNGLPNFMKGLGLGKKIYKRLIKDYKFISTFSGNYPSIESDLVWNRIVDDKDVYSFLNNDNIISFWNDCSFDFIIEKLKIFYKNHDNVILDDDFILKYDISKTFLKEL